MSLLVLDHVWKRFAGGERGVRERVALRDVCMEVEAGELVAVWGRRRSGRSTLLQVAAGVEPPSEGRVRFDGRELVQARSLGALGGIAYCNTDFARILGDSVLEHVAAPLLGGRISVLKAQARASETLARVEAADCGELEPGELDHTQTIRVAIARALVTAPRMLLADDPTDGVPPASKRDTILELLRSLAHRDGLAVLIAVGEATDLAGADRALTIDGGELRGQKAASPAPVLALHRGQRGALG